MNPKHAKFIAIAEAVAQLSKDRSTKVGAVAIGPATDVRSVGYNGFPRGCDDDVEARHQRPEKYFWTEHAERNLIFNAARNGVRLEGCTLVVSGLHPCMDCARAIVQAGIVEVIAPPADSDPRWAEHSRRARELFAECGVIVHEIPA